MTLKLHHLRPAPGAKTAKTRVGRGRAPRARPPVAAPRAPRPATIPAALEGGQLPLHMRLPKLKGSRTPSAWSSRSSTSSASVSTFPEGGAMGVEDLVAKGLVRKGQPVKVLGQGDIDVAVQVSAQAFSGLGEAEDRGRRRHNHGRLTHPG